MELESVLSKEDLWWVDWQDLWWSWEDIKRDLNILLSHHNSFYLHSYTGQIHSKSYPPVQVLWRKTKKGVSRPWQRHSFQGTSLHKEWKQGMSEFIWGKLIFSCSDEPNSKKLRVDASPMSSTIGIDSSSRTPSVLAGQQSYLQGVLTLSVLVLFLWSKITNTFLAWTIFHSSLKYFQNWNK